LRPWIRATTSIRSADGVDCAACGQFVPTDRIRVLARRDDIAFVEIHCPSCRSESLES